MPYKNIIFIKLEKRLLNDYRWYMMTEQAQLNYIRFILLAAETYNKIPKKVEAIKMAFRTEQDLKTIESTIQEIKNNYPKFKENKDFYYFEEFESKTNYVGCREFPGNSPGIPKEVTDIDIDKEKEKEYIFETFWKLYPSRKGKKLLKADARQFFLKEIKDGEIELILQAVRNYSNSETVTGGFARDAIRFLKKEYWRSWIEPEVSTEQKGRKYL